MFEPLRNGGEEPTHSLENAVFIDEQHRADNIDATAFAIARSRYAC
jgi:hypothetical protein